MVGQFQPGARATSSRRPNFRKAPLRPIGLFPSAPSSARNQRQASMELPTTALAARYERFHFSEQRAIRLSTIASRHTVFTSDKKGPERL